SLKSPRSGRQRTLCRPFHGLVGLGIALPRVSLTLHPGLYADTRFAGWNKAFSTRLLVVIFLLVTFGWLIDRHTTSSAQPSNNVLQLDPFLSGLQAPTFITSARDSSNRLFIIEQAGRIRVLQPGARTTTVFLDITARVLSGGERGLLGLAFHPQYRTNRRFFVNYTRRTDGATMIA